MVNRSYLLVFGVVLFKERHFCISSTCINFPNSVSVSREDDLVNCTTWSIFMKALLLQQNYGFYKLYIINFFHTHSYLVVFFLLNIQEQRKYF